MSIHFIGVDAGGTGTRALLATAEDGRVVGRGVGPGANAWSSGGSAADAIAGAVAAALGERDPTSVAGGCIAVAGGISSVPERTAEVVAAWRSLGLTHDPQVVIDVVAAFAAGTTAERGLVLAAGTGAIAAFIDGDSMVRRAGGRGWLVGDEGSAVWLGVEGVRAALLALDRRGPSTSLAEAIPVALGLNTGPDVDVATRITDAVYGQAPALLGRLAPLVVAEGDRGDQVALALVARASDHLLETAIAAAGDEEPVVVVLGGSVLHGAHAISERVRAGVHEHWPDAEVVRTGSGEAGAVALAIRAAGMEVTRTVLRHLREGARA